jgi:hypothetical protein
MKFNANLIAKFILCYILMECFFDSGFANMPFNIKLWQVNRKEVGIKPNTSDPMRERPTKQRSNMKKK